MAEDCYAYIGDDLIEVEFMGIYQYSQVLSPSLISGGHSGGVIAYPIALVKIDGVLKEIDPLSIVFKNQ